MGVDRRLHGDCAQQLQRMVLHHVAQGAGGLVERATAFYAQIFRDGDLDVGDVLTAPQRLEQGVAKAHGKQVLYRGLAQVVVDAEDLLFFKELAHGLVDRAVRGQVMAQRLFQHHTSLGGVQPGGSQLLAHIGEQAGRRGHVDHHAVGVTGVQCLSQGCVIVWLGQVHALELEDGRKAGKLFGAGTFGQLHFFEAGLDQRTVLLVAQVVTAHTDDASTFWQRAMAKRLE